MFPYEISNRMQTFFSYVTLSGMCSQRAADFSVYFATILAFLTLHIQLNSVLCTHNSESVILAFCVIPFFFRFAHRIFKQLLLLLLFSFFFFFTSISVQKASTFLMPLYCVSSLLNIDAIFLSKQNCTYHSNGSRKTQ